MSQPTVARRIDALEHDLGLTLFLRDTRGFRPTDTARALLPAAEGVGAAVTIFSGKVEEQHSERPIRITAHPMNIAGPVATLCTEYALKHPETVFSFLPTQNVLDLMAGEADIALRNSEFVEDERLIRRKIATVQLSLYAGRDYAARHDLPRAPEEMKGHRLLVYQGASAAFERAEAWMRHHGGPDAEVKTFGEIALFTAALNAGQGLGLQSQRAAAEPQAKGDLIHCFGPVEELDLDGLMLIPPQAWARPEVRRFVKFFAARLTAMLR